MTPWTVACHGFFAHGILQARILEWIAIPFSRESYQPRDRTCVSYISRQMLYHGATKEAQVIFIGRLALDPGREERKCFLLNTGNTAFRVSVSLFTDVVTPQWQTMTLYSSVTTGKPE